MNVLILISEKYQEPARAIRHDGQRQAQGKFEGEPTYKSKHTPFTAPNVQVYLECCTLSSAIEPSVNVG